MSPFQRRLSEAREKMAAANARFDAGLTNLVQGVAGANLKTSDSNAGLSTMTEQVVPRAGANQNVVGTFQTEDFAEADLAEQEAFLRSQNDRLRGYIPQQTLPLPTSRNFRGSRNRPIWQEID
jgi:glutamine synthetase type III